MITRRIFAMLPFLAVFRSVNAATISKPSGAEILRSFDARDWAKAFVAYQRANPAIATDEGTMTTWFANALMRGYDERYEVEREAKGEAHNARLRAANGMMQYDFHPDAFTLVWPRI